MAGAKETPRQKMIGMMYLVLTALLALNVSSETLQKFLFLNNSLDNQVRENVTKHERLVAGIATQVSDLGNRKDDRAVLDKANRVREATSQILAYTDELKKEMIKISGGTDPETGKIKGIQDMDKVANYMINKGNGNVLKERLNKFAAYLNDEMKSNGLEFLPLAYDGREHPVYRDDKEQRTKDFATLSFHYTPTAACLATVTQLQTQVVAYEGKALDALAKSVGAKDVSFDKITPMVRAKSNIVAAGTKYEAEMFIAASASGQTPEMYRNGALLPVVGGKGRVEFVATGGNYDSEGLSRQTYKAEIKLKDTTYTEMIEYFVARPVIQIQSAAVQALYLNCGNDLNVQVPALGALYNPTFTANGGAAIPGSKKGLVTVVPTGKELTLNVSNSGTFIGSEKFPVRGIPLPTVVVKSGTAPINMKQGVPAPGPRAITLEVVPDESFATFLPKDARYRVTEFDVLLGRGAQAVAKITSNSPTVNLAQFAQQARPGDRIVIEIKEIQRMNFRNETEKVRIPVTSTVYQIPLN